MKSGELWERYRELYFEDRALGIALDVSHMGFDAVWVQEMAPRVQRAMEEMKALESGAIANPDENRMVGHYWLRAPHISPREDIQHEIAATIEDIKKFTSDVIESKKYDSVLVIGIGGSALGPQFSYEALRSHSRPLDLFFFDNTDPDGFAKILSDIPSLKRCLCIVISKSGSTKETRNGFVIAERAWQHHQLNFAENAVAITGHGSLLHEYAQRNGWKKTFPMWDFVGGRTSQTSAVGLVPLGLSGASVDELLRGAREMDELSRRKEWRENPAMLLALSWYFAGNGCGEKAMVVLPYRDRLELFGRYLQQLIMESLGKELDVNGEVVHQGLSVYGNKGSTDQHAYVQQLRDGLDNFFVVFVEVLSDFTAFSDASFREISSEKVESSFSSADFLSAFLWGTRRALTDSGRSSLTVTLSQLHEHSIGMLIALFERAVGYYASFIRVNAYHQPGVEAGKRAAGDILDIQSQVLALLQNESRGLTVQEISTALKREGSEVEIHSLLRRLVQNEVLAFSGECDPGVAKFSFANRRG